ncbi:MAG: 4Fe-4S dicluster domain-containing protein [Thermoanaerobaculaceae bacterium]|nr:4Fe-4S dicluster domain-containing protein [Thermoanaerobaculaceae bacterium]TAM49831.1 MAG: 4Fe-4S dicluster domain-containing protein [Acidobacteriota bacterium]
MLKVLLARLRQGHRTSRFPAAMPALSDRFRGVPSIDPGRCREGCRACADACPTGAIAVAGGAVRIDLGRCLFCTECEDACPAGALTMTGEYRMATRSREDLVVGTDPQRSAAALDRRARAIFGRSLRLRQVSAGGCNGCEADAAVLQTIVFDMQRFGIGFVASPRHADGLLVTGPVTANMRRALLATYDAVPAPKLVIVSGACAISGGPFAGHPEIEGGATGLLPVDLFVPGCPPHPATLLDGLLRLLGRLPR